MDEHPEDRYLYAGGPAPETPEEWAAVVRRVEDLARGDAAARKAREIREWQLVRDDIAAWRQAHRHWWERLHRHRWWSAPGGHGRMCRLCGRVDPPPLV